ncbi:hypothetical protein QMA10_09475 [Arthrobacter sp. APC 3897]|uniref:hypothetical protein n=1 Tax=Arthrobacter sp. APC 3897 TaxID=3035204 RepID=UPI0025B533DC|nr:hypothetical protein [Arthrobacter sp. APC 3897]MDN3482146.1 hypothetical protein [Arthrobacter sp. APC 3897]
MISTKLMPKTHFGRSSSGIALAMAAVFIVSGCGGNTEPQAEAVPTAEETFTPQAQWPEGDEKGTLANPYSIGEEMVDGDWSLTIDDINLDANAEMAAKDSIISKVDPEPGNTWVILTATWTYNGDEPAEGGTSFAVVNENWNDAFDTENRYGTTFNDVSTLKPDESEAGPAEPGSSVTGEAILQMPVEYANDSSMIVAKFNYDGLDEHLVKID